MSLKWVRYRMTFNCRRSAFGEIIGARVHQWFSFTAAELTDTCLNRAFARVVVALLGKPAMNRWGRQKSEVLREFPERACLARYLAWFGRSRSSPSVPMVCVTMAERPARRAMSLVSQHGLE